MIHSMTAFARKEDRGDDGTLIWEIRSVNHRFLETNVRLPEEFRSLDPLVRRSVAKNLGRGKIDCTLRYEAGASGDSEMKVNMRLAQRLIDAAEQVDRLIHETVPLRTMDVLSWPGVLEAGRRDLSALEQRASQLLESAIGELKASRAAEGEHIEKLIHERCAGMREMVRNARERMPVVIDEVRQRLRDRLAEVTAELDETRIEQELALLAQRLDVDEEMDRLANHIDEVEKTLKRKEPIGRRLDFLMQELNREANTLGSKSNDIEITRCAVEMKVLIEQMREQVQNCE